MDVRSADRQAVSRWNHHMCLDCWKRRNGDSEPCRLIDADQEVCCYCGEKTTSGIIVRADPSATPCDGKHEMEYPP